MAIFALVENGKVTNTVICDSLEIIELILPNETIMPETEETLFAWIGSEIIDGKFKPPQPYESWSFDSETFVWVAPTPMPEDGKRYYWNESKLAWVKIIPPEPEIAPE